MMKTIQEIAQALRDKTVTVADLVAQYKNTIAEKNEELNVFLEVFDDCDEAIARAQKEIDENPNAHTLTGIPFALKDNILFEGHGATAASKALEGYVAPYSATATQKIIDAGAICVGRVNMDEFAMGGSTENSAFGVTKNPAAPSHVSGGSSGGSAAAVASDMVPFSLGSDTGGSIRQPASFCGVVGLKPTYGSVSRHGLIAMSSSLDVIGPLAHSVSDAEIIFNTIAGTDALDATTSEKDTTSFNRTDHAHTTTQKIAVPRALLADGVDEGVLETFNKSLATLEKCGYEIVDVDMSELSYALAAYYIIMPAEVSSNMARFDGVRYGAHADGDTLLEEYVKTRGEFLGKEVRRRIILGTYVLSSGYYDAYYGTARAIRERIQKTILDVLQTCDAIALPTSPTPAFKIGERTHDPLSMYLADIFTVSVNLAGVPAMSIPAGSVPSKDDKNVQLPVGLQLVARPFGEQTLFEIGKKFEKID